MASRLAQMQARFQQKQMQEKEERLLKLYESQQQRAFERVGRGSAGSNTSTTSIGSNGGGKVRQMFDERRQKAGVDKSYPLEPLKTKTTARGPSLDRNSFTVLKSTVKKTVSQVRNGKPMVSQQETYQRVYNNNYSNGTYEENTSAIESYDEVDGDNNLIQLMTNQSIDDNLDNEELPKIGFNENYYQEKLQYVPEKPANVGRKLPSEKAKPKPTINGTNQRNGVIKHEVKVAAKKPIAKTTTPRSGSTLSTASSQSTRNSAGKAEAVMSSKQVPSTASSRAPSNNRPSARQTPKSPVVRDDLAECRYCGRRFATDRLGTHEDICGKTGKKKRKTYDATKHRVLGTELEGYVLKPGKKAPSNKMNTVAALTSRNNKEKMISSKPSSSKANWRRTHEEFIATIRAAKQAQAYVAKGGKLSDLPPPPPASNPDYVQCPHCGRRFNESAAQRHIPKCASFQFNKPKNGAPPKGRPAKR